MAPSRKLAQGCPLVVVGLVHRLPVAAARKRRSVKKKRAASPRFQRISVPALIECRFKYLLIRAWTL